MWHDIHQTVLRRYAYQGRQVLPLLVGEAVDTAEIIFRTETPALGTKAIYTPDLKRSQTKAKQLGAVCYVGIEHEGIRHYLWHCIISG
jgi:hypothetical protein